MKENARKYSFGAGIILLVMCFYSIYNIVYNTLSGSHELKKSYWEYTKMMYERDRWGLLFEYVTAGTMLFLVLALLIQSRVLFLLGCMVNIALFVVRTLDWAESVKKIDDFWKGKGVGLAFSAGVVIPGLVVLLLFLMAIALLAKSNMVKLFGWLAVFFTSFTFGAIAVQDFMYIYRRTGKVGEGIREFRSNMICFGANAAVSTANVFYMMIVVICIVSWAVCYVKSKTEGESKPAGIAPANPGQPGSAPFVPAPANPAPVNPATPSFIKPLPETPATPVAPATPAAPVAPVAPVAPAKPVEVQKPAEAAVTAAEIDDAYEKITAEAKKVDDAVTKTVSDTAETVKETVSEAVSEAEETVAAAEEYVPEQYSDDVASILGKYADDAEEAVFEAAGEAEDFAEELAADAADAVADAAADAIEKNE